MVVALAAVEGSEMRIRKSKLRGRIALLTEGDDEDVGVSSWERVGKVKS
jgi:hypothetical protein